MIEKAKREGVRVTCDVSAHHLHLSEMDIGFFDSNCHLRPPLRGLRDREALRKGVQNGVIDAVCSDHTPVDEDAKLLPFGESEAGVTALELLLPLALKWAGENKLPASRAIAAVTHRPAEILNIPAGQIGAGSVADICIYDPSRWWKVERRALKSQGKNTPYLGMELQGKVRYTLVNGHVVHEC